ncbi:MAG: AI-2E family transporter [Clostridia bacterium]|nr:AI-2E family transporter [Clostridia bacterium]NCC76343.1 AI-2E family transporter [Clostridia bacterium]
MEKPETRRFTPRTLTLSLVAVVSVYFALDRAAEVLAYLEHVLAVAMPLLLGMAIAYLMNLPMRAIERFVGRHRPGHRADSRTGKWLRPLSLVLTLLGTLLVSAGILALVVPQVIASISDLSSRLPSLLAQSEAWINQTTTDNPWLKDLASTLKLSTADLLNWALALLQGQGGSWLNSTVNWLASAFGWVVSLVLSLIFAIYLLLAKEKLQRQSLRLLDAIFTPKASNRIRAVLALTHQTFSAFFAGQFLEAIILGVIFLVILAVFQFPYALLIAVLIAVTALIPMVGAYIALVVGAFLILLINPWQALAFVILFLVIQQLENNLIYPRVVGSSIGLPALWVLTAVVIGGGLLGVLGMILFIPFMSVAYALVRQWVVAREMARQTAQKNAASAEAGHGNGEQETVC